MKIFLLIIYTGCVYNPRDKICLNSKNCRLAYSRIQNSFNMYFGSIHQLDVFHITSFQD